MKRAFTLVELLIVIALIAILSVAVLATINPIEQSNKAKDSTVQNDAAEVMNAYERYYANAQRYPWMEFAEETEITVEDAVLYESDQAGFGICYAEETELSTADALCNTTGDMGLLVESDELKGSFAGKSEFQSDNAEDHLWVVKTTGSGGGIYVCYIPKAKANRQLTEKLYCIDDGSGTSLGLTKADDSTIDGCIALETTATTWDAPTLDGTAGMFRCVPE